MIFDEGSTLAYKLYGVDEMSGHVAIYPGLMLLAMPLKYSEERISVVPSKYEIEAFFKPSQFDQIEMELLTNEKHVDD